MEASETRKSGSERRQHPRVPVHVKVVTERNAQDFAFSYIANISVGGMAFDIQSYLTESKIQASDEVRVKFKLPHGHYFIVANARVIWVEASRVAVQFINLEPIFLEDIKVCIAQHRELTQ